MLSKRERYAGIVAAVVVGLLLADWYVLSPLLAWRDGLTMRKETLARELEANQNLLTTGRQASRKWAQIRTAGLKDNASEAESQLLNSLRRWSQETGLTLSSVRPERASKVQDLQEITFQAVGAGNMRAVAEFFYKLETSQIPVRVHQVQLSSRAEGGDDLAVQIRVSTICRGSAEPVIVAEQRKGGDL